MPRVVVAGWRRRRPVALGSWSGRTPKRAPRRECWCSTATGRPPALGVPSGSPASVPRVWAEARRCQPPSCCRTTLPRTWTRRRQTCTLGTRTYASRSKAGKRSCPSKAPAPPLARTTRRRLRAPGARWTLGSDRNCLKHRKPRKRGKAPPKMSCCPRSHRTCTKPHRRSTPLAQCTSTGRHRGFGGSQGRQQPRHLAPARDARPPS
mmetsp:Transcript_147489/g.410853  ORF Transcript_147489/g.410853 Transcript_147489/m.410853 type:complete len:207 (-) Transcript_147489:361-981(-)